MFTFKIHGNMNITVCLAGCGKKEEKREEERDRTWEWINTCSLLDSYQLPSLLENQII
jgi:hypothetical protein